MEVVKQGESETPLSVWKKLNKIIVEIRETFRQSGLRGVFQRYGWKLFAVFFVYYLIRDVTLYIILPYLVAKHLLS